MNILSCLARLTRRLSIARAAAAVAAFALIGSEVPTAEAGLGPSPGATGPPRARVADQPQRDARPRHGLGEGGVSVLNVRFIVLPFLAAAAIALGGAAATSGAHDRSAGTADTFVTDWDLIGQQAYVAAGWTVPEGHELFAYLAIAVYDSVMAIDGSNRPFIVDVDAPEDTSKEAAVAAAAHEVLVHYLPPSQTAFLDASYATSLQKVADGQAKTNGENLGKAIAGVLIAVRGGDGFRVFQPYTPPNPPIPGVWFPTAPTPPAGTFLPGMRPFSLESVDRFRPKGPPALSSKKWARDYNEVKEIGSSTSTTRTTEQTLAARFWAEPPIQQLHGTLRNFIGEHQLDIVDAARFMAMLGVVIGDAQIACYEAKYHFAFWRPITAIRAGDTDGNDDTVAEPGWSTLLPATPNHPEYPSAHACLTPALGKVVSRFLGTDDINFTVVSVTGLGDRHFEHESDLEYEVTNARIWGGIHYRSAIEDGTKIGLKTADQVLAHHFHQTTEKDAH